MFKKENLYQYYLIVNLVFIVILCIFMIGCDALYRILDKEGAQEKELVGEVIPFESNPTVEEIQILLKLYGYTPGKIDGAFGTRTRNAIAEFQRENELKETRFADTETWKKLILFKHNELVVENKINIYLLQTILEKTGFSPGKVDGKLGIKTISAVRKFQKEYNLKVDGRIGYQTLKKLAEFL